MYQCKFNFITEKNFENIVNTLKDPNNTHICQFSVDEKYPKELFDVYYKTLKGRKYKKKKMGKGKGKKSKAKQKTLNLIIILSEYLLYKIY